jgi:hypothetical protein
MSFYGNSYHYTVESFAKVVLLNSGLGNYLTAPDLESNFEIVSKDTPYHLDAINRNDGLGI